MAETINIPIWVAESTQLTWNEKALYSVYYFFTFKAQNHVCKLTNSAIAQRIGMCLGTLRDVKKSLIDKGFIKTNGGISVTALIQSSKALVESSESVETQQEGCRNPAGTDLEDDEEGAGIQQAESRNPAGSGLESSREDAEIQHHNIESKEINIENKETYNISTSIGGDGNKEKVKPSYFNATLSENWFCDDDPTERNKKNLKADIKKGVFKSEIELKNRLKSDQLYGYEEFFTKLWSYYRCSDNLQ